jgi:hypothetical protein
VRLRNQACPTTTGRLPTLTVWFAIPEPFNNPLSCKSNQFFLVNNLNWPDDQGAFENVKLTPATTILPIGRFKLLDEGEAVWKLARDGHLFAVAYRAGDEDEEMVEVVGSRSRKRKDEMLRGIEWTEEGYQETCQSA